VPSACRNYLMRQLFTPVFAGVFFCADNYRNGGIIAASCTLSQGLALRALRLALRVIWQDCGDIVGTGRSQGVSLDRVASG
jgi:hypothetical protein